MTPERQCATLALAMQAQYPPQIRQQAQGLGMGQAMRVVRGV